MFRDILSGSRAIFIGVLFFVLVVGGSLLYSWHVHHTTDAELAETRRKVQPLKNDKAARTTANTVDTRTVDFGHAETPLETGETQPMSDDTSVSSIDETSDGLDLSDAFLSDDFVSEEEIAEDVPVSPYGFGPYPEVPDGFSKIPPWLWSEEKRQNFGGSLRDMELIYRVLIKLWNQEDRDWVGAKFDEQNGRVYPLYRNRIYVTRWIEIPVEGGKVVPFPAGGSSGGSDWKPDIEAFVKSGGKIPGHIQFIDRDTAGYNPYEFLNLR